jgi:hypothetical protein
MAVLGPGPAFASPLTSGSAAAYGIKISLLNSNLLGPVPVTSAGPAVGTGSDNLLEVDLQTLAFVGAAGAKSVNTRDSVLTPELPDAFVKVLQGGPAKPATYNVQAYARTAGLQVAASQIPGLVEALAAATGNLLSADAIHSEALASCVQGRTVIAGGSQMVGAFLLGIDLGNLLDGTVNQVVPIGNTVLGLLGGSLVANEQVSTPNSLSVNALHLTLPLLGLDIVVAHSEVTGTTCAPVPQCQDGIDNDGDGKIDFGGPNGDPECKSLDDDSEAPECSNAKDDDGDGKIDRQDPGCYSNGNIRTGRYDPNDDTEADLLPRTGGDNALMGFVVLAGGALMLVASRKLRKTEGI